MSKDSRSGGKFTGNHTTLIPLASFACDVAAALSQVTKISLGFIAAGNGSGHGHKRIKFVDEGRGCILLKVRDNASYQEVRVYTINIQAAKVALARKLRDEGIAISFTRE
jgi:hypothetical protein